jgi:DnaD/phage-associated family protein
MTASKGFAGFPEGKLELTPVPTLFFYDLLIQIDHLGELKLTIYAFWALSQREGAFRYLSRNELMEDQLLMGGFESPGIPAEEALDEALERAVARGTLIMVSGNFSEGSDQLYFLNSEKGRTAVTAIESGNWLPADDHPIALVRQRPNIFTLYEQNIGPLTPIIAERLRGAEKEYPAHWIEEAIQISVENNVRKWRYIEAILEDWRRRGKDEREDRGDTEKARRRYIEGQFADFWDA